MGLKLKWVGPATLATLPVKDLVREFDVPEEGGDAVSANDT